MNRYANTHVFPQNYSFGRKGECTSEIDRRRAIVTVMGGL
mgnify:CR=1 FL=1